MFEAKSKTVGIIFGRFNPPHQGHKAAWEMASENNAWFVGTNQSTQGPKDPLPYDIKVKAMLAIMPEIKGHIVPETSWLTLASKVYKKYGDVTLNVYTDEDWVTKALVQYNGKEGAHGLYNFSSIQQQPTPRLSSATALRAAVQAGDRDAFAQAAGVDADTPVAGHPFFDVVAHYLTPYAEKEKIKAAKKKVKQPEQDVAEGESAREKWNRASAEREKKHNDAEKEMNARHARGEEDMKGAIDRLEKQLSELSTELLGRYKKAAGADAKKADAEGDYKRANKRFSGIVKATKKQFANDEKNVEENYWDRLQREKALESAGVGIITKQNSTVDVNKNTPKKNLKAFRLI
jgi:nicotinamide mononucleotide adenylyltransferase